MLRRIQWMSLFLILFIFGVFYLESSNEWILVEKAMSEKEEETKQSNFIPKDFSLRSVEGEIIDFNNNDGRDLLLFFFTSWCHVCAEQWEQLELAQQELDVERTRIIAINLTKEEWRITDVEKYLQNLNLKNIEVALDTKGEAQKLFRVKGIPTSFIVDDDGQLVKRTDGLITADKIIEELLQR